MPIATIALTALIVRTRAPTVTVREASLLVGVLPVSMRVAFIARSTLARVLVVATALFLKVSLSAGARGSNRPPPNR